MNREDLTIKYRGIYDKATTGRSPKAAIHANCLFCTTCQTDQIRDCSEEGCPLWKYRPYQEIPHKFSKPKIKGNLNRLHTGQIAKTSKKSRLSVSKDLVFEKSTTGPVRVHISVEAINGKKE